MMTKYYRLKADNGWTVRTGEPFKLPLDGDEIKFPGNWLELSTPEEIDRLGLEEYTPPPPPPKAPPTAAETRLSKKQLRLALFRGGKEAVIAGALQALEAAQKREYTIEMEYADSFSRDHPFISWMAGVIGMTDEELDAFWLSAAEIS